eukprot:7945184-Pyramimonas_sp.AAC.1
MIRLLDVGAGWVPPLRQVPPLFFSYSDQHIAVWNHMCGYCAKGPPVELPSAVPFHLVVLDTTRPSYVPRSQPPIPPISWEAAHPPA